MDTLHNKKKLQALLRQIGIEYPPAASMEDLLKRLQNENQDYWMRLAKSGRVLRNKRMADQHTDTFSIMPEETEKGVKPNGLSSRAPAIRQPVKRGGLRESARVIVVEPPPPIPEQESAESPNPPVVLTIPEIKNYALNRAKGVCDLCETDTKTTTDRLTVLFFIDPPEGKSRTPKEAAALCPACLERVKSQRLSKDIKVLKRKARRKRISEVQVSIQRKGA